MPARCQAGTAAGRPQLQRPALPSHPPAAARGHPAPPGGGRASWRPHCTWGSCREAGGGKLQGGAMDIPTGWAGAGSRDQLPADAPQRATHPPPPPSTLTLTLTPSLPAQTRLPARRPASRAAGSCAAGSATGCACCLEARPGPWCWPQTRAQAQRAGWPRWVGRRRRAARAAQSGASAPRGQCAPQRPGHRNVRRGCWSGPDWLGKALASAGGGGGAAARRRRTAWRVELAGTAFLDRDSIPTLIHTCALPVWEA